MKASERKYKIETSLGEIGWCWSVHKPQPGEKRYTHHIVNVDWQGKPSKPRETAKISIIRSVINN